jgi:putative SOS response-associated peptidase YedK
MLADEWIEWQRTEDRSQPRQPFLHRLQGGEPFAFVGLWTVAQPKDADEPLASRAVITTDANVEAA